ncbi:monocarboxylate transporter 10 isoform X1 [Drosophila sulfurigaster albostrigata]|uniref:monocarboxylate transporter 10 isoform X1 n=1 Tax=Drosophila sulfurigaster albostrigata TaxID=89887 RepID=UPI002D21E30E|nr:monocarboxylate transporter 10 isoform X1 [Drosophila sulfurigaster albostrigata]
MTEHEPLDGESSGQPNGRILSSMERANGHASLANNGQLHTAAANGKSMNGNGTANGTQQETHIEAPCCRDIHGKEPPDGGARAWLVMISAFLCNGVIFGLINTYGVLHKLLTERLTAQGDTEANSKAALVGSLAIGTTFFLSPVAGCLTDKIGLRLTTFLGGMIAAGGLLLSSFCADNINALYFTYGIMFGLGGALAYTPTLAILGHYFKRYLGKVSGFVTAGSSVFTVILPPGLDLLLQNYGLETTLRIMSLMAAFIIVCSFVYKPLHFPQDSPKKKNGRSRFNVFLRSIVNVDIWKRKRYVIWALCVPLALFGYFVPYVHMMKFVETSFPGKDLNLPVMCIGVTSGIGRLIFGVIADLPGVNRMYLQQLSLVCIGLVTLLLPLTSSYTVLVTFALIMGLFDGCFISLLGPIAYEICGPSGATQAIGFLLGLCSLPLTIGPPVAGMIFERTGSYTLPLILAGIPPLIGSSLLFLMRCVRDDSSSSNSNGIASGQSGDIEDSPNGTYRLNAVKSSEPLIENGVNGSLSNGHANTNGSATAVKSSAPLMGSSTNGNGSIGNGLRPNGYADSTTETLTDRPGS